MTDRLSEITEKLAGLHASVGRTPMIEIFYRYRNGPELGIHVKCEQRNLSGSIKDRLALYVLSRAYERGTIRPGETIVEASTGNCGIAFVAIGRALGHPVKVLVPDWVEKEWYGAMEHFGAQVQLFKPSNGNYQAGMMAAERELLKGSVFLTRQLKSVYRSEVHERWTGPEIWQQIREAGRVPYALVAAVGTGGTVLGTGQYLKSVYPGIHIYPLELAGCPDSAGLPGRHPARGMGGEALPIKADLSLLDKVITVSGADSVMTAQKIRAELGLEVGASSGANLLGAIKVQLSTGSRDAVVTFFPDKPKGELALPKPAANADGHDMSPHITLTGFRTLGETGIKKANG